MKSTALSIAIVISLVCIGVLPEMKAVTPPPTGGYPGGNTAAGQAALSSLTAGTYNTAIGVYSLTNLTDGSFNTAIGAGTLLLNTADQNTAVGSAALLSNTSGANNTAVGEAALFSNTGGSFNTGIGDGVLNQNTGGSSNTALGVDALSSNTAGNNNTAIGDTALNSNSVGNNNIAVGVNSGFAVTTANNVICIGASLAGANQDNSCFIGQIFGATTASGTAVFIDSNNKLGTVVSSKRFKEDVKPIDKASEKLFSLKPVSFRYKKEIDPMRISQLGLIAEEVEKVDADLVVRDKEGKPYSVRYDQVNAMLLNEFLKEHRSVQDLKKIVADQQRKIEALTAGLQKVGVQLEASKLSPQTAMNNP